MRIKFYIALLALLSVIILVSCSTKTTEHVTEIEVTESDTNEKLITELKEFFNYLNDQDFGKCITYFSDSLMNSPDKERIIEGLKQRCLQNGLIDSIQIYYLQKNVRANSYTCYVRSFYSLNKKGILYDRIAIDLINDKIKISSMEFSTRMYCDAIMANDTLSEINQFLNLIYTTLTEKGVDEAYLLLDPAVAEKMSMEKFTKAYNERKSLYTKKTKFTVKSVWTEIRHDVPVINLLVESACVDSGFYIDEVLMSDRMGKFFIVRIDRKIKGKNLVEELPRPTDIELRPYADIAAKFYNLLAENNSDKIVEQIDKIVFLNNEYNNVKNSFSARNVYYGIPTSLNNTNVKAYKIDGDIVVDFSFSVTNSLGKKSYEKVSVIKRENSRYLIYGYDYRDQPF